MHHITSSQQSLSIVALVGRNVRQIRELLDLTQDELARKAGLTRVTINQIECGKRSQVKPSTIRKIANATGHSVDIFYRDASPPDTFHDFMKSHNLSRPASFVLLKLISLPQEHQETAGRMLEQLLIWYEREFMS